MPQTSIKKNFAYKSALTVSNYLMAFMTFPYVSRVLGVERIGLVNFVDNTVNYFLLFATMGIGLLGVREIAAVKYNQQRLEYIFSNILGLNLIFTLGTLVIYILAINFIPQLHQYSELFYIGTAKIIFTVFLVEWFFTGIEHFRYITIRSVIIKLLYIIAVFYFIRAQNDYKLYFILTVGVVVVNAIINFIYVRRFIRIHWKYMIRQKYVRQNLSLGFYSIMTSMYLTFNVMFLGFVSTNTEVGYYTTAFKLYTVVLSLFTAFTNVMLPRMSSLLANGEEKKFQELINKSFNIMCFFCMPIILYSIILASPIIYILSGNGYEGAILPMQIIMPATLIVCIAQVLAIQIFLPMHYDKILFKASSIGAIGSLFLNISLVPYIYSIGSSIVLLCAELLVTTIYIYYTISKKIFIIKWNAICVNIIYSLPVGIFCLLSMHLFGNIWITLLFPLLLSIPYYWIVYITKKKSLK